MSALAEMTFYLVLLVSASAAHHISSTPPRIAQESSDHLMREQNGRKEGAVGALHGDKLRNRLGMAAVAATKYVVWAITALEVISRLLCLFPSSSLSRATLPILLPSIALDAFDSANSEQSRPQNLLYTSPSRIFLISLVFITIGFIIRRKCFAAMGRHFSFTHTTLEGHQLVRIGPYNTVRHPSYTGEVLVRFGMAALLLAPGGFVQACGALKYHPAGFYATLNLPQQILLASVRAGIAFYIGWISFGCTFLILRASSEDATLRETFGKEWDTYRKEVPYRFVPYVA